MALKRMLLIPPELREKCSQPPATPPPVKQILKSKDHSFDKWTKIRVHQDPYLKTEIKAGTDPSTHSRNWRYSPEQPDI
jgi:hypothetical protein